MASAAPAPGPGPFGVTAKSLLGEKVASGTADLVSLSRQILKGSRSAELLGQAARNMAAQEDALLRSEDNMKKMQIITSHLQYQSPYRKTLRSPQTSSINSTTCSSSGRPPSTQTTELFTLQRFHELPDWGPTGSILRMY
ncbi:BLOC-1-related complex subunit 7 isoform X1 [Lampetra fluviatilis]